MLVVTNDLKKLKFEFQHLKRKEMKAHKWEDKNTGHRKTGVTDLAYLRDII